MKKYYNRFAVALCGMLFFVACQKNEAKITYDSSSGVAPVLSSNFANNDTVPLIAADSSNNLFTFSWTNPNYTFSNGISSLNVNYRLEIDTAGANFTNPKIVQIDIASNLNTSFTVGDFNSKLGNSLLLQTGVAHTIAIRVEAFVNQGSLPLYSNVFSYVVTPYAPPPKITPPASGTLFIVGSAVAGGWDNPISADPKTQQFTQVSTTEYEITIPLIGAGEYKFIGVNGSWDNQWSVATADTEANGGPLVFNGANCIAPAASGTYDIDVNFQLGVFTVKLH